MKRNFFQFLKNNSNYKVILFSTFLLIPTLYMIFIFLGQRDYEKLYRNNFLSDFNVENKDLGTDIGTDLYTYLLADDYLENFANIDNSNHYTEKNNISTNKRNLDDKSLNDDLIYHVNKIAILKYDGFITNNFLKFIEEIDEKISGADLLILQLDLKSSHDIHNKIFIRKISSLQMPVVTFVSGKDSPKLLGNSFLLGLASDFFVVQPDAEIGMLASFMDYEETYKNKSYDRYLWNKDYSFKIRANNISEITKNIVLRNSSIISSLPRFAIILALRNNYNISEIINLLKNNDVIDAKKAYRNKIIDFVANDTNEILNHLHGSKFEYHYTDYTISIDQAKVENVEIDTKYKVTSFFNDPQIIVIFLTIGLTLIFIEIMMPGAIVPGFLGFLCIALALFSLWNLPFNSLFLILIFLGVLLIASEFFLPTFGLLGFVGILFFLFGNYFLFPIELRLSLWFILTITLPFILLFIYTVFVFLKSRKEKSTYVENNLVGADFDLLEWDKKAKEGIVKIHGEIWAAMSDDDLDFDKDKITVSSVNKLKVKLSKMDDNS